MEDIKEIEKVLRLHEPIFHNRSLTNSRADVENETLEDYWEISASGKYYSRQFVLDYLEERYNKEPVDASEFENWQVKDFKVEKLAEDVFLATYILVGQYAENGGQRPQHRPRRHRPLRCAETASGKAGKGSH